MKTKGFTLIEMLSVLIILSLLGLMVSQVITNRIKDIKKNLEAQASKLIVSAAREKVTSSDAYKSEQGNTYCISYSSLIADNLLTEKMIPKIDEIEYIKDYNVRVTYNGELFEYTVVETCQEEHTYTITFDSIEASYRGTTSLIVLSNSEMENIDVPKKTNYIFMGYYSSTNGSGSEYFNKYGYGVKSYDLETDTTLYAYWISATIAYQAQDQAQDVEVPRSGWYKIELYGASGNQGLKDGASFNTPGYGGYVSGYTYISDEDEWLLYVGSQGTAATVAAGGTGGYNGGGAGGTDTGDNDDAGGGGGATDIRLDSSLASRIMVAGGGSGSNYTYNGGSGGGLISLLAYSTGYGSTQISGNAFGVGGIGTNSTVIPSSGAGGGYYGGFTSAIGYTSGGGSSFISGYAGCNAVNSSAVHVSNTKHYSGKFFIGSLMSTGVNNASGYAVFTYVEDKPARKITSIDNVRYIKDCINGSSASQVNHWIEIQAIKDGENKAKDKTVIGKTSSGTPITINDISRITDGDIIGANYAASTTTGLECAIVDLEQTYDLDEVAVWHYWGDARTYNNNVTYVSSDNVNWTTIISTSASETANGKRISAY